MISIKDLIDNKTTYSTTRWAFVVAMRFAIVMSALSFICFIILRFLDKSTEGLFSGVTALLGVVVGLTTTAKALQGFETKKDDKPSVNNVDAIAIEEQPSEELKSDVL